MPLILLAAAAPVGAPSGTYFDRLRANGPAALQASDAHLGRELWTVTEQLVEVSRPTS